MSEPPETTSSDAPREVEPTDPMATISSLAARLAARTAANRPAPPSPDAESAAVPAAASPADSAATSPADSAAAAPADLGAGVPEGPIAGFPDSGAAVSPDSPAVGPPDTSAAASPVTPRAASAETPDAAFPDIRRAASGGVPPTASPDTVVAAVPDAASPSAPDPAAYADPGVGHSAGAAGVAPSAPTVPDDARPGGHPAAAAAEAPTAAGDAAEAPPAAGDPAQIAAGVAGPDDVPRTDVVGVDGAGGEAAGPAGAGQVDRGSGGAAPGASADPAGAAGPGGLPGDRAGGPAADLADAAVARARAGARTRARRGAAEPPPVEDRSPELADPERLRAAVEAVLLVIDTPTSARNLAEVLGRPAREVLTALRALRDDYDASGRGMDLREVAGGWRLYSRDEFATYVERFILDGQQAKLTQAALETLAVIAYRQPVTRSRISAIRGVSVDAVMRTLLTRGLVEECGADPETGGGLYRTTGLFLEKMGLRSLDELPSLAPLLPDTSQLDDVELST